MAHWRYSTGHGIGDPPPPKLREAVELFEMLQREKAALRAQASAEKARVDDAVHKAGGKAKVVCVL